MRVMLHDIAIAREAGADGIVFGCLTREGQVDATKCRRLLAQAGRLDATFHRAFDMTRNLSEALEDIIGLGIKRVLTSGGHADVPTGATVIAELVRQSKGRAAIMPGGGVTEINLREIVRSTGLREIHLSAREAVYSAMIYRNEKCSMGAHSKDHEYEWREASVEKIRTARVALEQTQTG
jgi:copper homeostasis protein